jgi:hypothetical protein
MSTRSKHLAAFAVAAMVAACGGGDGTQGTSTPEAVISALRAQALTLATVAPAEAARQLMDFGEAHFPQYFPSHQATLSEPPFAYRYYPQTGVYLGVVLTPGSMWAMDGVYVMGGPFGAGPQFQGLLTDFITPVDPGTATANGCFDLNLAQTPGTHIVVDYSATGAMTGSMRVDSLVGGLTTFEGQQALLTTVLTTGSATTAQGSTTIDTNMKLFSSPSGTEVVQYGQEFVTAAQSGPYTLTTTNRTVWNPPYADPQYTLALGQSATSTLSGMLTTTISGIPGVPGVPTTTSISSASTTRYVGRESVTVPAGVYETCNFEVTAAGSGGTTTTTNYWVIVGKGIAVRSGAAGQISSATAISINGQPL